MNIQEEIDEANKRLPMVLPDSPLPIDYQLRCTALLIAQRHVGETCVKEGALYQQLKMDNKLGNVVSVDDVVKTALVFERYLWGEWSKGIAESALNATMTEVADAIEDEFEKRKDIPEAPPTRGTP